MIVESLVIRAFSLSTPAQFSDVNGPTKHELSSVVSSLQDRTIYSRQLRGAADNPWNPNSDAQAAVLGDMRAKLERLRQYSGNMSLA